MVEISPRPRTSVRSSQSPQRISTADPSRSPRRAKHQTDIFKDCPYRQSIDLPVRVINEKLRAGKLQECVRRSLGRLEEGKKGSRNRTRLKELNHENRKLNHKLGKLNEVYLRLESELTQLKKWSKDNRDISGAESPPHAVCPPSLPLLKTLKSQFQCLQKEYEEAKKQEDVLEQAISNHKSWVQPSFQAALQRSQSKRLTSELFPVLWQGLLQELGDREVKHELSSLLRGKRKDEATDWLLGLELGFTKAEVTLLLGNYFIGDIIKHADFVAKLKEFQPYPLFEDLEPMISTLQLHFALQNRSKTRLVSELSAHPDFGKSQSKAKGVLKEPPYSLPMKIVEVLVGYLFKGKNAIGKRVDMDAVESWELLRDVLRRVRREFALRDVPLEAVESQFLPSTTPSSLQQYCQSTLGLSDTQGLILCAAVSSSSSSPVRKLASLLAPAYPTYSTAGISECFQKLSEVSTSTNQIFYALGLGTPVASRSCLCLKPFLDAFQKEFKVKLTKSEKWAVKLFAYRETKMLNAFNFTSFLGRICDIRLKEGPGDIPPQPAKSEEEPF